MPETCRGLFFSQNKIWEISASFGFIIKKYITISVEILKEENHLEDIGVNGRILSNGVQTNRI